MPIGLLGSYLQHGVVVVGRHCVVFGLWCLAETSWPLWPGD